MNARDNQAWVAVRMIGEAATRTALGRSEDAARLSHRPGFLDRRLQGREPDAAALEPAVAPADPARRRPHDRLGLAAGRLSAPDLRARHARLRQAGNQMQTAMTMMKSRCAHLASWLRCRLRLSRLARSLGVRRSRCRTASPPPRLHRLCHQRERQFDLVIDTDKMDAVKTVKVGHRPRGIALAKDGARALSSAPATTTPSKCSTPRRCRSSALCRPAPIPSC